MSVNGQPVLDSIDFRFRTSDEGVKIVFADRSGNEVRFRLEDGYPGDLGLTLDDGRVMVCKNNCIFCFVHQQPKGMRRALYVKDEDYRLSFTHGNFVTLSNTSESEIERIIRQRLSPLYVSVHTTNENLRGYMLGNRKIAPILPRLKHLSENGIKVHTQVVLCPGINDGKHLEKTMDDLSSLYPGVSSLAVVPVGLTKYRKNLPELRSFAREEAADMVKYVGRRQRQFFRDLGSRFVWLADEFYIATGKPFPRRVEYEDMPQFENGVGMAREFITMFNRRRAGLSRLKPKRRLLFLTGKAAAPILESDIMPYLKRQLGMRISLMSVENRFWGKTVTVSGLLTGKDLLNAARPAADKYDTVILPPNCLNSDDLFLDDLSLEEFSRKLGKEVIVGKYDLARTLKELPA